ncbi:MAG TPA: IS5 family transposase [Brachybacterium paraconglomeratum]|uniref:IS5 family transposase n=1 Tax=Brachybacterium paraconglomeratum TaxID=173362 RepID=A0A921GJX0_9MICO|nr:IS5 family transposase [Brachybacterium paraconglomeratum]
MATATTRHQVLSDEQWERIEPLLPSNKGRKGHPFRENRKIVEGIIYRSRTGIPWRDLPREQFGPWQTVWKRHYLYARLGVWDRIHAALMAQADAAGGIDWTVSVDSTISRAHQHGTNTTRPDQPTGAGANHKNPTAEEPEGHAVGRSRGGLGSKVHAAVDGNGMPLAIVLTGGQRNDGAMLVEVLDDIRVPRLGPGRPRTRPAAVVADKAYSSGKTRRMLAARGIKAVIPQKSDELAARQRKGSCGGRPPGLDQTAYAGRNVVERQFGLVKQWRGIATRYDKHAITYRASVVLCAVIAWLRK